MQDSEHHPSAASAGFSGPGVMLISAALFGYFGFFTSWSTTGTDGQFLPFVAIVEWSLKGGAIGFAVSGILAFFAVRPAEFIYAIVGIITAIGFVIGGVLDLADTQHTALSPFLLFLFAAWNGYGSFSSLKRLLQSG
ncbi:MAG: hypothetical protein MK085_10520 [Phycisphaerales bacterium]|nr:hypothetical protein [Phycisphaerales bacterium]